MRCYIQIYNDGDLKKPLRATGPSFQYLLNCRGEGTVLVIWTETLILSSNTRRDEDSVVRRTHVIECPGHVGPVSFVPSLADAISWSASKVFCGGFQVAMTAH